VVVDRHSVHVYKEDTVSDLTRRGFVKGSAGAAAGLTVLSALLAEQADAHSERDPRSRPIIAYVANPKRGEIAVMAADREMKIHDRKLAARLARAVA
jgi:hypothetical protein